MAYWSSHALADPTLPAVTLKRGQACVAAVDLPGVPRGTKGKVQLAIGFNWPRYRVRFANNVELNGLDGRHLSA